MGFIDLHVHSSASDGSMSPSAVVSYAREKGLEAIALTDHDTVGGVKEAVFAAKNTKLTVISGIELSCVYKDKEIHILGLFLDASDPLMLKKLDSLRSIRDERNEEIIRRLSKDGVCLTLEELTGGNDSTVVTRAHFAKLLEEKGYVKTREQAFKKYLSYGGPYCPKKDKVTPKLAMELLKAGRALPILAHPLQYRLGYGELEKLTIYLKSLGMQGLEVYHSSNNQYESMRLRELARRHDLLPSGGSDFHGANKPDVDLGTGRGGLRISSLLLDDLRRRHELCVDGAYTKPDQFD